jgi:hypothetical protein
MRVVLFTAISLFFAIQSLAWCPAGSYPWVDHWGNEICRSFESGRTTTIKGNIDSCPAGTYPWVDDWGNQICRSFDSNQQYYDTSQGCPTGTHPSVDDWGNQICLEF